MTEQRQNLVAFKNGRAFATCYYDLSDKSGRETVHEFFKDYRKYEIKQMSTDEACRLLREAIGLPNLASASQGKEGTE